MAAVLPAAYPAAAYARGSLAIPDADWAVQVLRTQTPYAHWQAAYTQLRQTGERGYYLVTAARAPPQYKYGSFSTPDGAIKWMVFDAAAAPHDAATAALHAVAEPPFALPTAHFTTARPAAGARGRTAVLDALATHDPAVSFVVVVLCSGTRVPDIPLPDGDTIKLSFAGVPGEETLEAHVIARRYTPTEVPLYERTALRMWADVACTQGGRLTGGVRPLADVTDAELLALWTRAVNGDPHIAVARAQMPLPIGDTSAVFYAEHALACTPAAVAARGVYMNGILSPDEHIAPQPAAAVAAALCTQLRASVEAHRPVLLVAQRLPGDAAALAEALGVPVVRGLVAPTPAGGPAVWLPFVGPGSARCGGPACVADAADAPVLRRCVRCKQAAYCSETCQRAAWHAHRAVCAAPVGPASQSAARSSATPAAPPCGATADELRARRHAIVLERLDCQKRGVHRGMPEARAALREIMDAQTGLLGAHAYETLMTRHELARCAMDSGDFAGAEPELRDVGARLALACGPHHAVTLSVRSDVVACTMAASRYADACADVTALAEISAECIGADAPSTLHLRRLRCECLYNLGRFAEARAETLAILGDCERLGDADGVRLCATDLGTIDHAMGAPVDIAALGQRSSQGGPGALPAAECADLESCMRRRSIMQHYYEAKDYVRALQESQDILAALRRIPGISPGHQDILRMRGCVADCLDELGHRDAACAEYRAAIAVAERALGAGHATTLHLRKNLAVVTSYGGNEVPGSARAAAAAAAAEAELRAVLATQQRPDVGSPEHEVLATQMQIAVVTTDAHAKTALLRDLVPRLVSVCGPAHRNTLAAQRMFARGAPRCDAPRCDAAACTEIATHACGGCTRAIYCSQPCQAADWPAHKPACTACAVCGATETAAAPLLACNRCGRGRYCSKRCRHADWAAHKPVCQAAV